MCGIFGVAGGAKKERARDALDTMVHRGPDDAGEYAQDGLYLGHRRLSILDLSSAGHQPMETKSSVILANGEIYNFKELKKEIGEHKFKSHSDSEVLLHGFEAWGIEKLLQKIEGMYAFCIYDKSTNKLHLARDRVGIKPLYYYFDGHTFAFASELKAIKSYFKELETNKSAIYDFFTYLYIPTPKSLYKNCYKLEPATYVEFDVDSRALKKKKYWEIKEIATRDIALNEAKEELVSLLKLSVKEHLIADVPVGFFLSGGVDSSIVTALSAGIKKQINTYSIGFDVEDFSETRYAKIVADLFCTNHHEEILSRDAAFALFEKYTSWYDEPHADTSALPTYLVSSIAKKGSTVVLTGDGGDEVFGGYAYYPKFEKRIKQRIHLGKTAAQEFFSSLCNSKINVVSKNARKLWVRYLADELEMYSNLKNGMDLSLKFRLREPLGIPKDYDDYWYYRAFDKKELDPLTRLQYIEFNTLLPDDMLTKVDRTSMATSLEARVPLLDRRVVEFAFSLPTHIRFHGGNLKGILKYAFEDMLPKEILYRKKRGFGVPFGAWEMGNGKHKTFFILEIFGLKDIIA